MVEDPAAQLGGHPRAAANEIVTDVVGSSSRRRDPGKRGRSQRDRPRDHHSMPGHQSSRREPPDGVDRNFQRRGLKDTESDIRKHRQQTERSQPLVPARGVADGKRSLGRAAQAVVLGTTLAAFLLAGHQVSFFPVTRLPAHASIPAGENTVYPDLPVCVHLRRLARPVADLPPQLAIAGKVVKGGGQRVDVARRNEHSALPPSSKLGISPMSDATMGRPAAMYSYTLSGEK